MSKRGFKSAKPKISAAQQPKTTVKRDHKVFVPTSTFKLFHPAWQLLKRNFVTIACIIIIPSMLSALGQVLTRKFLTSFLENTNSVPDGVTYVGVGLILLSAVVLFINAPVVYYVQLQAVHGQRPGVLESYRNGLRFWARLYGLIAILACLFVATAFLIFPLFIFTRRYILSPYFLIDGDTGIRVAMQRSAAATKPYRWRVWETILVTVCVVFVGFGLATFLKPFGSLSVAPIASFALLIMALRYQELSRQQESQAALRSSTIED